MQSAPAGMPQRLATSSAMAKNQEQREADDQFRPIQLEISKEEVRTKVPKMDILHFHIIIPQYGVDPAKEAALGKPDHDCEGGNVLGTVVPWDGDEDEDGCEEADEGLRWGAVR